MANFIPKIEWDEFTVVGTTSVGSPIITGISDTTGTEVGMFISGTGIPVGAKVDSFTATTITMDVNATAAGSPTLTLLNRITFSLPPDGDNLRRRVRSQTKQTKSTNGTIQSQHDYTEEVFQVNFAFLTQALIDSMENFMTTHALKGRIFKYFEHNDEVTSVEVTLGKNEFAPRRLIADGSGGFIQNLRMDLRRLR